MSDRAVSASSAQRWALVVTAVASLMVALRIWPEENSPKGGWPSLVVFEAVHDARGKCEIFEPGWGSSMIFEPPLKDPIPAEVVKELLAA